ncbi:hypothetical protein B0H14DRAFT_3469994 [Mycena olivaceomarginata]|nr:hypothetical protein B0H14DRAFT_3469994 [Mycena olivaceomarginata]
MASLFTSVTTKHSVHPCQPVPPPVVLPSLLTPIACFDFPVLSLNELSLQCGLQLQRRLQLQHEDSLQHDSPLTDVGDESQYLKLQPIFVSNIKAFFPADSDYESFKNCINEVAAQHLEMERYLDHQDKDAKKKVFDKLTIDYPFLKKCPECWPVAFCLQMKLHNNMNRANKRASAEAITTLKSIAPGGGPSRRVKSTTTTTTSGQRGQKRTRASLNAAPHVTFEERV